MHAIWKAIRQPRAIKINFLFILLVFLTACGSPPPKNVNNICAIFAKYPRWYWEAKIAEDKWQVPIPVQLAIIRQESYFEANARPPREYILGVIPGKHLSTALGYAQALNGTWAQYQQQTHQQKAIRSKFNNATDFVAWYAHQVYEQLGIPPQDTYDLYLAYHEGLSGYAQKSYLEKPWLMQKAEQVAATAKIYQTQLASCENTVPAPSAWNFWLH